MPSNETLAYIAGLFDGEGCVNFTVAGKQRTRALRAMIRNTDRGVVEFVQSIFGGRIETAGHKDRPHWKPSYCWRVDWDHAVEFLSAIDPWVRIKKDQILVALFWYAVRRRRGEEPYPEHKEMTHLLADQLAWLNRKGPRATADLEPMTEALSCR